MSLIGFVLLMASIIYGGDIAASPVWGPFFTCEKFFRERQQARYGGSRPGRCC